ncbi:phosphonate ABC transporter, permease protein PhnE [Bradyrhizobium sp. AUGA SZCCT0431]|uniref:phosphonate ABC transporter, permease protein PhnE n=1 Tax=Bradyrhizobium sp. AUGA SZCCT0431 TaxID=2807674 RepID=UPI001BABC63A|nr:phosphonate ABC transporter, permease protein PhnE [Bradyrhizobium sp. AUGA SZCCT0431]MBR1143785.1 phosphonate ABC transporter, permease protein PhnE [Bradyrhizobium sp. AUGA SZCCT0431]
MSQPSSLAGVDRARLAQAYPDIFRPSPLKRMQAVTIAVALVGLFVFGMVWLGFSFEKLVTGIGRLGVIIGLMFPPSPGGLLHLYLKGLAETLAIAFLGTLLAAVIAFPLAFIAAKNVVGQRILHFLSRRFLDTIRGVDTLIWALIFINVVGLGPFAGILAVAMSDIGSFGKLFSEAIETADTKQVDGVTSTGGSALHQIRFGVVPQVLPVILSQVLYYFESNTRSATVIGIVGAGGIGLYLSNEINQQNWDHVAFLIIMILITVAVIDFISARLRFAIIGRAAVLRD